jgi:hypothetical protein
MNRFKTNYDFIVSIFFSFLLWHVSTWELINKPKIFKLLKDEIYSSDIFPNRIEYTFYLCLFFIVLRILFFSPNIKKKIIQSIISIYIEKNFTSNENNRVTIYKAVYGFQFLHKYLWKVLISGLKEHYKKDILWYHIKSMPIPWSKYLVQYTRSGFPYPNGSSTFFLIPNKEEKIQGLTPCVYYKEKAISINNLPDLNNIDFKAITELKGNSHNVKNIKKYMKNSHVNNFEKLKSMHRYPTDLFASPLFIDDNKWGVIILDSVESQSDENFQVFQTYSRIIHPILSN